VPGPTESQRYEIIAGERRWRAAQLAGLTHIPAVVRRVADEAAVAMALIENIQRENLNPLEEARALERLISEFGLTHQQAADAVGRSRAAVSNLLRLLELPPEVCERLEKRELEMGHARALLGLPQRRQQIEVAAVVVRRGLTVRDAESLVRRMIEPAKPAPDGATAAIDPNIQRLEEELAEQLGARVSIEHARAGHGRLVIRYHSLDELDGILIAQPVRALHRVIHMPAPVIGAHIAERRGNAALGRHCVTAGREYFRQASGGQTGLGQTEGGAQTRAPGADDDHIVRVVDQFVFAHNL